MQNKQTHFEQVPLERIKWILDKELQKVQLEASIKTTKAEKELLPAVPHTGSGGRR